MKISINKEKYTHKGKFKINVLFRLKKASFNFVFLRQIPLKTKHRYGDINLSKGGSLDE